MIPIQIVFLVAVCLTIASGIAATSIVIFGDTRRNAGHRAVTERFSQITVIGATAIVALLTNFPSG